MYVRLFISTVCIIERFSHMDLAKTDENVRHTNELHVLEKYVCRNIYGYLYSLKNTIISITYFFKQSLFVSVNHIYVLMVLQRICFYKKILFIFWNEPFFVPNNNNV